MLQHLDNLLLLGHNLIHFLFISLISSIFENFDKMNLDNG